MSSPRAQFTMRTPGFMMAMDVRVDQAFGLRRQADVQREVVGVLEDLVERGEGDAILARDDRRDERVVGDQLHAEGGGAPGDFEADAAEADDAERLAAQLRALQGFLVPFAGVHGLVRARDAAAHGDHQAERQLGDGDGVGAGRVHHHDAVVGGGGGVDVVDAHAGAADDAELGRVLEQRGVGLDGGADDEGVGVGELGLQGFGASILSAVMQVQPGSCCRRARVAGETFSARTIFMWSPVYLLREKRV